MKKWRTISLLAIGVLGLMVFFGSTSAFAQNCALCYTQAASSGSKMIQALKSGILILIAPPTFGTVGLIVVCYRRRNATRDGLGEEADREWGDQRDGTFRDKEF